MNVNPALKFSFAVVAALTFGGVGCGHLHHDHEATALAAFSSVKQVIVVVQPTAGNKCAGVLRFTEVGGTVYIAGEITGLSPGQKHAMHIHEFGDGTSADGAKAGGHYNPEGNAHGLPGTEKRHAGDLGNLQADASGKAVFRGEFTNISMAGPVNPIIGRGVIIHAKPDDGGQPVGNAGPRIGFGVIGVANPAP